MLAWLSVWSKVQTCMWPSWCYCHSLSLNSVKSRLVSPFWYRLTQVVPDKGSLNRCVCVCGRLAQMDENKPSSNLLQRTGGDHQGGRTQPGWRTFMMTCLRWIFRYMRLEIWRKIDLSGDSCLCTALHTRSGACYYWIGETEYWG